MESTATRRLIVGGSFAGLLASVYLANYLVEHVGIVRVWPTTLVAPAGVYVAGVAFLFRDTVQRLASVQLALLGVAVGAALSWFVSPTLAGASALAFARRRDHPGSAGGAAGDRTYRRRDRPRLSAPDGTRPPDLLPECPRCRELCPPGATVCAECGTRLFVKQSNGSGRSDLDGTSAAGAEGRTIPMVKDCTCGDAGVCNACTLASYDRDPFAQALEHAVDVVTRPANVVELKRYSKKAS